MELQIQLIQRRTIMQLLRRYEKVADKLFPLRTHRRYFYLLALKGIRVILNEGWRSFWFKARRWLKHKIPFPKNYLYQLWIARNEPKAKELHRYRQESLSFQYRPKISIITPVWNIEEKWFRLAIESVINQMYDNWELCIADGNSTKPNVKKVLQEYAEKDSRIKVKFLPENKGIPGNSNEALSLATGEFIGLLDHDDELRPDALYEVVKLLNQNHNLDLIYTDEDKIDTKGRRTDAFFKPDWSPDLLMSMNYISHFTVIRKELVDALGGFRRRFDGSQDYDLILRATEKSSSIAHIPKPLYSWRRIPTSAAALTDAKLYAYSAAVQSLQESLVRRGIEGEVVQCSPGIYQVRYKIRTRPLVSIIIPTRNLSKLRRCIESVEIKTAYRNYEVIVIHHDSRDPKTIDYLSLLTHRVVKYCGEFNFSKMNNMGVGESMGEHIVFLNDDTEVIEPNWLEAMLEHSQRPEVGMVGALLLYPPKHLFAGKVQHAGVVLGIGGIARHAFRHTPADYSAYFNLEKVVRNCSAVTAACAMIKKSLFREVGGFDEGLPVAYNDVDLCLRLRERGYLIVYTPFAVLYHYEGGTRDMEPPPQDATTMLARWADTIARGDPYYNQNLTLYKEDFSLRIET